MEDLSILHVNNAPLFVRSLDDSLRFGSFVYLKNVPFGRPFANLHGRQPTSIGRLLRPSKENQNLVEVVVFPQLFNGPGRLPKNHPLIPNHRFPRIVSGLGLDNTELYQSNCFLQISPEDILQIAFVFSLKDLAKPKNKWSQGLRNVFFVRYKEVKDECPKRDTKLVPMDLHVGHPVEHPDREIEISVWFSPRCYVEVVWKGLFMLRQAIIKILNKRSQQVESTNVDTCTIGMMSPETWMYLSIFCNNVIVPYQFTAKELYLDIDQQFTRKKVRTQYPGTVLRFQTQEELQLLRDILGFGSTYGSLERRPRLEDGERGLPLKPGHHLSIVSGLADGQDVPEHFKRDSRLPRVDLMEQVQSTGNHLLSAVQV